MLKYTEVVREVVDRGRYRYGLVKVKTSDLVPLIGKKVHVLIIPEGEEPSTQKEHDACIDICVFIEELDSRLEYLFEELEQTWVNATKSSREKARRRDKIQEIRMYLAKVREACKSDTQYSRQ